MIITAGKTNVSVFVYFVDDDGGTAPGEPTTGLLFSDIETGGSASYARQGGARVDLTLKTLASASADHDDGGFILVDDTNMPGLCRVDFPDAAFATGVDQVVIQLVAASAKNTVMRPLLVDLQTTASDVWNALLTGATFNIATSAGKRLRQIEQSFVITSGTAQAGGAASITLESGESASTGIFDGDRVIIVGGLGIGEHGIITSYDGGTKVATMSQNWVIQPDNTSEYELTPADVDVETWQHVVVTNSPTTNMPEVDVASVSDDSTAADNLELDYDGTGFDKSNSTIGTTTTNTDMVGTDDAALATDLATAQADLDILTGADGVNLLSATQASIDAIEADTDELQGDWVNGGRLDLILDIIAADTTTDIPALIAALNDLSAAQVNAEVVDVMDVDTITLPGQVAPPLTPTHRQAIGHLFKMYRNKGEQTATEKRILADDESTVDQKWPVSDDGATFTKGEIVVGP